MEAARAVSELTHYDPEAGDACVLWCLAIRHAVLTGELDARIGLQHIDADRRETVGYRGWMSPKHHSLRTSRTTGGWWKRCRVRGRRSRPRPSRQDDPATGVFRVDHLRLALDAAVRGGGDTDTVAAIAGGLLGAVYGASAVPAEWRRVLHGWPGLRTRDLVELASAITRKGEPDEFDFTYSGYELGVVARHPYDDGVWLGDIGALRSLPDGVDAVVSLCRVGNADLPARAEQIDVRLIDQPARQRQPRLRVARHRRVWSSSCAAKAAPCWSTAFRPKPHTHRRRALRREAARHRHRRGTG